MQQGAFMSGSQSWLDWLSVVRGEGSRSRDLYRHRLVMRFMAINFGGLALLGAIWREGWIDQLLIADSTGLVRLIAAVFLLGLGWCVVRVIEIGSEMNTMRAEQPDPASESGRFLHKLRKSGGRGRVTLEGALRMRLAGKIAPVRHLASMLVMLGLVGTVAGFVIALSGVNPETARDVSAIAPMVSTLIEGLGVALHTTLVGSVLNIWLLLDYRLLEAGTGRLYTGLVERGVDDV